MIGKGWGAWSRRARFVALSAAALGAVSWSAAASAALPSPEELVPNTVARISDAPGRAGTVTKAEFRRELGQIAATKGYRRAPGPGARGYGRLMRAAVDQLLEAAWIRGQAAEMQIAVTRRQVRRERVRIVRESFESAAEYRRFLREAHLTRRDIYRQVELQLLSIGIQRRVERRARGRADEQRVFDEFVDEFNEKWRSRTVCAPTYVTSRCSNGGEARVRAR
jgi:hypothetical protein